MSVTSPEVKSTLSCMCKFCRRSICVGNDLAVELSLGSVLNILAVGLGCLSVFGLHLQWLLSCDSSINAIAPVL